MANGDIRVVPNSAGAKAVLRSQGLADEITTKYVNGVAARISGSHVSTEIVGARRVIRISKTGSSVTALKKQQADSGEMVSALSSIGKVSRGKYATRLKRGQARRAKARRARYNQRRRSS